MQQALELAGFFAAHLAWSLADGETPSPVLAVIRTDGSRHMQRVIGDEVAASIEQARAWLRDEPEDALAAAVVYDGELAKPDGRDDAILIELRQFDAPASATIAIPYRPDGTKGPFALFKPMFLAMTPQPASFEAAALAFYRGVDAHEKAAPIWHAALDQS
jgi:hypothetical protein